MNDFLTFTNKLLQIREAVKETGMDNYPGARHEAEARLQKFFSEENLSALKTEYTNYVGSHWDKNVSEAFNAVKADGSSLAYNAVRLVTAIENSLTEMLEFAKKQMEEKRYYDQYDEPSL